MQISKAKIIGVDMFKQNNAPTTKVLLEVPSWKKDKPYEYVTIAYFGDTAKMIYLEFVNNKDLDDILVGKDFNGRWIPITVDQETGEPYLAF